jgi:maltose alpha-D-glucosyltransferase/alpha-amylase
MNRKILAYLRDYEGETILCVANVSRTAQAVELDLSEFTGRVPVELSGGAAFPMIGKLTYLLTLPPYGFGWFLLSAEAQAPVWSAATAGPLAEQFTFVIRNGMQDIVAGKQRQVLQQELLPSYILQRRWFQNKDEGVSGVEINAFDALPGAGEDTIFVELLVHVSDRIERYTLPLTVAWEDTPPNPFEAPLAIARVRRGRRIGLLTDAFANPALPQAMIRGLKARAVVELASGGRILCRPTRALRAAHLPDEADIHWPGAEQTNSTLLVGHQAVIKLFRHLTAGTHPEGEMSRTLTERGFSGSPALLGDIVRVGDDGQEYTLAVVQAFVDNQGDGWTWTLSHLARVVEEGATPFGRDEASVFDPYTSFARMLGRRLGEMHALLAQATNNPDFAPQTTTADDAAAWRAQAHGELNHALNILQDQSTLDGADADLAAELVSMRGQITARLDDLAQTAEGSLQTRIHGDLHLGQVLVTAGDVQIIDFEGEPKKPLEQRRAKSSPLRDIAGLIRSFDYAAAQVARNRTNAGAEGEARASDLLQRFRIEASTALLAGYAEGAGDTVPPIDKNLLDLFTIEKAAYEIGYEIANRPTWLAVPLHGLAELTRRVLAEPTS